MAKNNSRVLSYVSGQHTDAIASVVGMCVDPDTFTIPPQMRANYPYVVTLRSS